MSSKNAAGISSWTSLPAPLPAGGLCRHVGVCGGCATQEVPYEEQLQVKERRVRDVLAPFRPDRFQPIRPSPDVFFYRNKMEFVFTGAQAGSARLGLREKGVFHRVVDLRDCRLLSPETPRLLEAVRQWANRERLAAYDLILQRGFLRYLVVREGKNTGERMVHLVTHVERVEEKPWQASFLGALRDSAVRVDTAVWSQNDTLSDVAVGASRGPGLSDGAAGRQSRVLSGGGFITDRLAGRPFRISPTSFFQTNTRGAEILYKIIDDRLSPGGGTLFDLYCGSGTIGLFCADRFQRVVGVEVHAPAVKDAEANAAALGVRRAVFHATDAAKIPENPALLSLWERATAVIDPPRAGLQAPVRRLLRERPLRRWVYVSCNPDALAKDLPLLRDVYDIEDVQPVDLFPHTPHVETVVTFRRRKEE